MVYSPFKYFKYAFTLSHNANFKTTNGNTVTYTFTVGSSIGHVDAYDSASTSNGPGDSNTQIGDVTNDIYTSDYLGPGPASVTTGKFVGGSSDHLSFAGYNNAYKAYYLYSNKSYASGKAFTITRNTNAVTLCFASGTLIQTPGGDIAVEDLNVGDRVVTASGVHRPIRWLGHRDVDCAAYDTPSQVWPVRILAGAFGARAPARDLYLSPGHPILVGADEDGDGGHLVPAMCLINGTTIDRVKMDRVTYWHIELDTHDILLAEGLPAESYLDWGDRAFFSEAAEHALTNPDFVVPGLAGRCRPVALDGPVVEAERLRLDGVLTARLVKACAWPDPNLLAIF